MARRLVKLGLSGAALTDHASVSGVPSFARAFKDACKNCGHPKNAHAQGGKGRCVVKGETCEGYASAGLKLLYGNEFNVVEPAGMVRDGVVLRGDPTLKGAEHRPYNHLVCIARDQAGWKSLLRATSESNKPENFYYKPRLNVERLGEVAAGHWVAFSGHPGSALANCCFDEPKLAYRCKTVAEAKMLLKDRERLRRDLVAMAGYYRDLFGPENFFIEVQLFDADNMPAANVIGQCMRRLASLTGIRPVATPDAHYAFPEDAPDQRVLLCGTLHTTLGEVERRAAAGEDVSLGSFFRSDRYCIPTAEDMRSWHTPEELASTLQIAEMCVPPNLSSPPRMPAFPCPEGLTQDSYLEKLCLEGWERKIRGLVPEEKHAQYREQLNRELGVFCEAGLAPYFLVVWDVRRYAQEELGCPTDDGRGSAAGCLASYLLDITDTDPVKGKLLFERFYNAGRNAPGKVSLPDIDMDFPSSKRDAVIAYLRRRWGADKVAQIATFQTLQGREALKFVLRAHGWGSFDERNELSQRLPPEFAITDKLQEMREEEGYTSVIRWAVQHNPEDFEDVCKLTEDGEFTGPMGALFAQASRLEGCRRGRGRHPSGVIVSPEPLSDLCPLMWDDKSQQLLAGLEYPDLESMGLTKLDVLGQEVLGALNDAYSSIETGRMESV